MKFPDWAPKDLIEYLQDFPELDSPYLKRNYAIVERLLTRPEMEAVWEWFSNLEYLPLPLTANGGFVGRFLNALDEYHATVLLPQTERSSDFEEIAQLSRKLSIKLKKYKDEMHPFNQYTALIPRERDAELEGILSEENKTKVASFHKSYDVRFPYWKYLLPPMFEILESLSLAAERSDPTLGKRFPTKIRQTSSLSTFLINHIYSDPFRLFHAEYPSNLVATFLSVALDDPEITLDKVRKTREHFKKISKKSSTSS